MGTKHQYFNQNYATLALIIETASGSAYAEFMKANVFQPLGMEHSYLQTSAARQLARAILPHVIVPTVVVIATYRLVPLLMEGRGFNVRQIGPYYMPDLLLLLALAVIPDLLQGIYVLITALVRRRRQGRDDRSAKSPDGNHDAVLPI